MAGRWSQDGFDDLTVVHCLKGMMPFVKGPDSAESGGDIKLATGHHGDDRFPHGPVVAKAALKSDVFLNEGIQTEV